MKGMEKTLKCDKCHRWLSETEFDNEEQVCLYCLFPEAPYSRPVELTWDEGDAKNKTHFSSMVDNVDSIPEKQSRAAKEWKNEQWQKNYVKKAKFYK